MTHDDWFSVQEALLNAVRDGLGKDEAIGRVREEQKAWLNESAERRRWNHPSNVESSWASLVRARLVRQGPRGGWVALPAPQTPPGDCLVLPVQAHLDQEGGYAQAWRVKGWGWQYLIHHPPSAEKEPQPGYALTTERLRGDLWRYDLTAALGPRDHSRQENSCLLIDALAARYRNDRNPWAFIPEIAVVTQPREVRLDAFAMCLWSPHLRLAFELKVCRGDWLRELKKPEKRQPGIRASNQFFFVATPGIIKPEEVPAECGLLEYHAGTGRPWRTVVKAPRREVDRLSTEFVARLMRRYRGEEETGA